MFGGKNHLFGKVSLTDLPTNNACEQRTDLYPIVHLEGVPGSGKTTASKQLCEHLCKRGLDAVWLLEEDRDHPIMPASLRKQSSAPDFPDLCLATWRSYCASHDKIVILDGYALQSTVRLMFANSLAQDAIYKYFDQWIEIGRPYLPIIFLHVEHPDEHYEQITDERGPDWTRKLIKYVSGTPYGRANGLDGKEGFIKFWSEYQDFCLRLLNTSNVETLTLEAHSLNQTRLADIASSLLDCFNSSK